MAEALSALGKQVKQQDHDRYLTLLFAPAARRENLFALAAFNQELARTAERVSEPLLGEMRFAWWRDAVEAMATAGAVPDHPVAEALHPLVARGNAPGGLPAAELLAMVEARRRDLDSEPFASLDALQRYAAETAGAANRLSAQLLDLTGEALAAAEDVGTAWGLLGQLRSFSAWRRSGRLWLPQSLIESAGLTRSQIMDPAEDLDLAPLARPLVVSVGALLASARDRQAGLPKGQASPFLLGSLVQLYLKRLSSSDYNLADPRLADLPPGRVFRLSWCVLRRRW